MKGHRRSIFSSRNFNRNLLKDGVNDLSFPVGQYISILGLRRNGIFCWRRLG